MSKNNSIIGFIVGVAIGSIVTWAISKNEYEKRMDEEIQSMRRRDKKADEVASSENNIWEEQEDEEFDEETMENAKKIIKGQKYGDAKLESNNAKKNCGPHVIKPDDFGDLYDYEKVSLTYYADGVLTDEDDNIVDDVEEIVGRDSLKTFGQYEEDSVYVRNDEHRCDYEILLDERKYNQVKRPKV